MRPAQLVSLILAILLAALGIAPHLAIVPASLAVYVALGVAVLTVVARFLPAFSPTQIPANIADELATIVGCIGAVYGAAAPILLTIPGLPPSVMAWASSVVALLGAISAAVLPAPVKHPVSSFGALRCLLPWALLLGLGLCVSSCTPPQNAAWTKLGVDVATVCLKSAAGAAAQQAAGDVVTALSGSLTTQQVEDQGKALAASYGVDAAFCILQKAWADLGPVLFGGVPENDPRVRVRYLLDHPERWVPTGAAR